jgi:hypothetical protein
MSGGAVASAASRSSATDIAELTIWARSTMTTLTLRRSATLLLLTLLTAEAALLAPAPVRNSRRSRAIRAAEPETEERPLTAEETTEKYGLEAGLFQSLKESLPFGKGGGGDDGGDAKGGMATAGDLLKRYGGAYLLTSTSLAVVSFSFCYWAVSNGVDVGSVLKTVGINVDANAENVGTVGIAYAIHKAASPIRFPPTVALTPLVAKRVFGKTEEEIAAAAEGGEAAAAADGGAADGGAADGGGFELPKFEMPKLEMPKDFELKLDFIPDVPEESIFERLEKGDLKLPKLPNPFGGGGGGEPDLTLRGEEYDYTKSEAENLRDRK